LAYSLPSTLNKLTHETQLGLYHETRSTNAALPHKISLYLCGYCIA